MQWGSNRSRTSVKCEYKLNLKKTTKLNQLIKRCKFSNTKKSYKNFANWEKWNCTKLKVSTAGGVGERLIKLLCSSVLPLSVAESTLWTNFQPSKDYIFSHADEMGVRMAKKQKINNTFRIVIRPQKMPDVVCFNRIHFYTVCMGHWYIREISNSK